MNSFRLTFIVLLISIINFTFSQQNLDSKFTAVVDAGHGGKDPGNTGNGYLEKTNCIKYSFKAWKKIRR